MTNANNIIYAARIDANGIDERDSQLNEYERKVLNGALEEALQARIVLLRYLAGRYHDLTLSTHDDLGHHQPDIYRAQVTSADVSLLDETKLRPDEVRALGEALQGVFAPPGILARYTQGSESVYVRIGDVKVSEPPRRVPVDPDLLA